MTSTKNGTMSDLCQELGKLVGVPGSNLMVTDVYNHRSGNCFGTLLLFYSAPVL